MSWDAEDRVKTISYNGTQKRIEYDYDGLGRRVRIRWMEGAVKTAEYLYVWDGLKLCEKRDSAVAAFPVAIYYPQDERKFLSGSCLNYFYLRDRLGSVRGATSATGSIILSPIDSKCTTSDRIKVYHLGRDDFLIGFRYCLQGLSGYGRRESPVFSAEGC